MRSVEISADLPQEAIDKILGNTKEDMDRMLSLGYAFDLSDGKDRAVTYISFPKGTDPKDVAPVVHAKWIECESGWGFKCSNCKARVKRSEVFNGNHHYCYKCGAKIDGGNE